MAAKPVNIRFLATRTGTCHVVTTKVNDTRNSKCPVVKKGHTEDKWGRDKGVSPDAALELKPCVKCETHGVAEVERRARMTPAEKRAETRAKSDATRRKLGKVKEPKPTKPKRKGGQRRGSNFTRKDPEQMKDRAKEHLELAKQYGWKGNVTDTESGGAMVETKKGGELLRLIYEDGRIVHSRVTLKSGVEVKLRNSANWRKHAMGEGKVKSDYQPRGVTKKSDKAVDRERSPEEKDQADTELSRSLPFTIDEEDLIIIDHLKGKMVTWRNGLGGNLEHARIPGRSRNVRITQHPKSGRRMISFHELHGESEHGEVLGAERTVYIDKILRVKS